jgi:hyperpolarization activated cyclic nucleotide-gated potassium channel 1
MRLLKLFFLVLFLIHLFACTWFYLAQNNDFNSDTWAFRSAILDETAFTQYIISIYWAAQTATTVGFGDILAKTSEEFIVCIFWMVMGNISYAITVANMTNVLAEADSKATTLSAKI